MTGLGRRSRFGTPILHGMITSAIMGAAVGMRFHGTALAYLEHNARFTAPVRAGDTLTTTWTVMDLLPKPKHGGIVCCRAWRRISTAWLWRRRWARYSSLRCTP